MKTIFVFNVICLLAASQAADAAIQLKALPEAAEVNFLAVGKPSMLKIHGKANGANAQLKSANGNLSGSAEFLLEKLDTGISLRNEHMKEKYLKVKEFPKATLTLIDAPVAADFEKTLSSGEKPFRGKLNLHGIEKEVSGFFSVNQAKVDAKFDLKLSEFGIELPSYLGITVAELVNVTVSLPLQKE